MGNPCLSKIEGSEGVTASQPYRQVLGMGFLGSVSEVLAMSCSGFGVQLGRQYEAPGLEVVDAAPVHFLILVSNSESEAQCGI